MSQNRSRFDVSSVNGVQHFYKSPFLVDRLCLKSRVLRFLPAWVSREKKKRKEKKIKQEKNQKQNKDLSIQAKGTIKRLTVWEALVQILALVLKTTEHEAF